MAYSNMSFRRVALGATIAGLPLLVMGDNRKWANAYVLLLVLGFAVTQWRALGRASAYFSKQL